MGRRIHNTCHTCPHAGLEGGHQHQFVNFPFVLTICSPHSTCLRNCTNYGLQLLRPTENKASTRHSGYSRIAHLRCSLGYFEMQSESTPCSPRHHSFRPVYYTHIRLQCLLAALCYQTSRYGMHHVAVGRPFLRPPSHPCEGRSPDLNSNARLFMSSSVPAQTV
jgi:hypothetical protein